MPPEIAKKSGLCNRSFLKFLLVIPPIITTGIFVNLLTQDIKLGFAMKFTFFVFDLKKAPIAL